MNNLLANQINELRNDSLHGAGWLSRKFIRIMQLAIQQSTAVNTDDFIEDLKTVAAEITGARPSMISITNYIDKLMHYIIIFSRDNSELELIKKLALTKCNELIKQSDESSLKAAGHGAEMIGNENIVITCSYSSTVCETLRIAYKQLNGLQVIAAESKYGNNKYGFVTAERLGQYGIPVTVIKDDEISKYIQNISLALVGADTISVDGTLINGVPTYKLAKACSAQKTPFYCICEIAKFNLRNHKRGHNRPEPGFEEVPPSLITGIITEEGIISPAR